MSGAPTKPRLGVGGVIFSERDGETHVVLVRRGKAPSFGRWSLPGGRLEWGELLKAGCAREILEETSLIVTVGALVDVIEIIEPPLHYVVHDYLCSIVGGELAAGDDAAEAMFAPVARIAHFGVTDAVSSVVTRALEMARSL